MKYVVGIDLGTTNTVVASAPLDGGGVVDFPVPQTVAPAEVAPRSQLPSAIYLAAIDELAPSAARLPWDDAPKSATFVGTFARAQGAKVPGRVIVSAKSWLCVPGVDRRSAILPWSALGGVEKMSPVDAQAAYLRHVRRAWDHAHPQALLEEQDVVVTVPASFDEVARELTLEAAQRAGLPTGVRLLEEPQAAFYAFLQEHERDLGDALRDVKLVLVVDIGGGTTDLTLVTIDQREGAAPALERIAVGDHLMLGGDNMDITLARHVERELTGTIGSLDAASWGALVESARSAKESLLSETPPNEVGVALVGRGSKLVGGSRARSVTRAEAESLLLDGFFPRTPLNDVAVRRGRTALTELGLPFAQDPAVTRHIAGFLQRHVPGRAPDAILLNGGVLKSPAVRARLLDIVSSWFDKRVPVLGGAKIGALLDLAVARGAAYSGLVRRGRGLRIGGGSPRSYFVGIGSTSTSAAAAQRALCVVPKGMHEGERIEVDRTFRLWLDRPVSFPLYSSTSSAARAGEVVDVNDELELLPSLETVLQSEPEIPVRVDAFFSEVGTLELSLRATPEALRKFKLGFSTRTEAGAPVAADGTSASSGSASPARIEGLPKRIEEGKDLLLQFYGSKSKDVDPKRVKDLRRDLEKIFGLRETWSTGLNRELAGVLLGGAKNRRRTAEHERTFLQLLGFTLRPGAGAPFDDWRIEQLWPLWRDGIQYVNEKPTWSSWWILWRRVAAGLNAERQREIASYLKPWLLEQGTGKKGTGPTPHGQDEMVRLIASLERVASNEKIELGAFVLKKIGRGGITSYWPLGRLGARQPLSQTSGSAGDVVPSDIAAQWAEKILNADLKTAEGATFALAQLCRVTGDRARDVDESLRRRVAERMEKAGAPAHLVVMVKERVEWTADDEAQAFGEALPPGLRL